MNHFLCCACDHRFSESEAVQAEVAGFVEYCCPMCGSDDVEDAENLEAIQAMKRTAVRSAEERDYQRMRDLERIKELGLGPIIHAVRAGVAL